ncbi:uncharacterized protein LOC141530600 [Cotesia typhae]|uniref:uncharacterized protein LOC141530600 n=1 Tax=Cotesia typhae TaxID=2053667 RepID=UPI003D688652
MFFLQSILFIKFNFCLNKFPNIIYLLLEKVQQSNNSRTILEKSPIHAIIPESLQKSNSSTPEQLTMKKELVSNDKFDEDDFQLLPTSTDPYPPELQARFNNYIKLSESSGLDFNTVMQNRKKFKNPSIYEKLLLHCGLDESGTNFSSNLFDRFNWGKEAHYDQLDIAQQKSMSQLEKSKTQSAKVEIVSGVTKHPSPNGVLVNKNKSSNVHNIIIRNNNSKNKNLAKFLGAKDCSSRKSKCEFSTINFNFKRPRC